MELIHTSDNLSYRAEPVGRPKRSFRPHDAVFALLMLPMGWLAARICLFRDNGLANTGFFLLMLTAAAVYCRKCGASAKPAQKVLFAVLCAFSCVFTLTDTHTVRYLGTVFMLGACIWWVQAVCGGVGFVTRWFWPDLRNAVLKQPLREIDAAPDAIASCVKESRAVSKAKTVIAALLITVPLTVLVAALLAKADSGIEKLLSSLLELVNVDIFETALHLLTSAVTGFWLYGILYAGAKRIEEPFPDDAEHAAKAQASRVIPNLGLLTGITPICVLYLIYVFSQMQYFVSAFAGLLPGDMIYSEYARRGFFELCAIAVINLLVLLVLNGCAKERTSRALRIYHFLFCALTLFIIATALAKMALYIHAYGLTRLRLYTAWFMVLLAIGFFVMLLRPVIPQMHTAAVLTVTFLTMFGLLCFSRPDALIAHYNIRRYEQGTLRELDVQTLCQLSDDAYAVMAAHTDTLKAAGYYEKFCNYADARCNNHDRKPGAGNDLSALLLQLRYCEGGI